MKLLSLTLFLLCSIFSLAPAKAAMPEINHAECLLVVNGPFSGNFLPGNFQYDCFPGEIPTGSLLLTQVSQSDDPIIDEKKKTEEKPIVMMVPEPTTFTLAMFVLATAGFFRRRR